MNDLIFSCTEALSQPETPCSAPYGERVVSVFLSKSEVAASGNVPTAAEFKVAYNAGDLTIIEGITNGHRVKTGETEIQHIRTEWHDATYRVEGVIRRFDNAILRMTEKMNRYKKVYFYFLTSKNYCFGPYKTNPFFSLMLYNGKGNPTGVEFKLDYFGFGPDYAAYDEDYDSIREADISPATLLTADRTDVTADSSVTVDTGRL